MQINFFNWFRLPKFGKLKIGNQFSTNIQYEKFHSVKYTVYEDCEKRLAPFPVIVCAQGSAYLPPVEPHLINGMKSILIDKHRVFNTCYTPNLGLIRYQTHRVRGVGQKTFNLHFANALTCLAHFTISLISANAWRSDCTICV